MAETDLPEGTDKIVTGAANEGSGTSGGATRSSAGSRKSSSSSSRGSSGTTATPGGGTISTSPVGSTSGSGSSSAIMDRVRSGTDKLSGQAADKARDFLRQGMSRGAEAIANIATLVGDTAGGIDENIGEDYGNYARRASESLRDISDRLASKDPDELIDDTRQFVRKSPAIALAGAAIVGFALARVVKAGFSNNDDGDDRD